MTTSHQPNKSGEETFEEFSQNSSRLLTLIIICLLAGLVVALVLRWNSLNPWIIYLYAGLFSLYLIAENRVYTQPHGTGQRVHQQLRYFLTLFWWLLVLAAPYEYIFLVRSNTTLTLVGTLVALAGILLRVWSVRTLGRFYSGHIETWYDHTVVNSGPYKWIRHPGYTGSILQAIGMPLVMNSYFTLILSVILSALFVRRMLWEEVFLAQSLPGYREYRSHTWRIIPGIW